MTNQRVDILFPAGRLIVGDLYKGSSTDDKGQPRVVKNGPNKGQPLTQFFIGVAIPKAGEQHWSQTPWGQTILAVGAQAFPNIYQNPTFAWKIDDGDSTVPNKKGRKPADMEGARGHWIVKFTSGYAPKVAAQTSPGVFQELTGGEVKVGYWIQVSANVAGNNSAESPGVYLNHSAVLFVKTDAEIRQGIDVASAFAGAQVSQGLPTPGAAALPFTPTALPPTAVPAAAALPPTAVVPNPGFLAGPAGGLPTAAGAAGLPVAAAVPPAAPVVPAMPTAPSGPQMTAKGLATGFTVHQFLSNGWSEAQMRSEGYIL